MNKDLIPDKAIKLIAVFFTEICEDFDTWADSYFEKYSRHLDDDFRALSLALPYEGKG